MKLNEEIQRLRADGSRPEAKGRVIAILQEKQRHKTMKLIGKLSIPAALLAAVAIGGMLSIPRTALASPSTVAKAIRGIQNYVINSFTIIDGQRQLTSKTTMADGKSSRQFFDSKGNPIAEGQATVLDGALVELAIGKPLDGEGGAPLVVRSRMGKGEVAEGGSIKLEGHEIGKGGERKVEIKASKGKDGKVIKRYFVDGKEVKELPADIKGGVKIGAGAPGKGSTEVEGFHIELDNAEGKPALSRGGMFVVQGNDKGGVAQFQSGQTSVDYLLKLLDDSSRWTITRGVLYGGQKLDKFTLNGPVSPIELYVDPVTSLPKVLVFNGPGDGMAPRIEDEYVYGGNPPK